LTKKIHVGDVDTAFVIRFFDLSDDAWNPLVDPCPPVLDISGATEGTELKLRFSKPGDEPGDARITTEVPATFASATGLPGYVGDGTDGYAEYRNPSGFIDRAVLWSYEGWVQLGTGQHTSEKIDFMVYGTIA